MTRRRRVALGLAAWAGVGLALAACGGEGESGPPPAPLGLQGNVVVEPPTLRIGQTAAVEVVVVTPPDHSVPPAVVPDALPGLWVLEVEPLPTQRDARRWIHRTRFLVRARATGRFTWPAQTVRVERTGSDEDVELVLPERALEVVEVAGEWPDRLEPFGFRSGPPPASARGVLVPALAGAGATLAAVGLVLLVRRVRRSAVHEGARSEEDDRGAWRGAQATLVAAEERAGREPGEAASMASAALRHYLTKRFRAAADTATTEELTEREAPWGLARSWPRIVMLLGRLDAVRFRPRDAAAGGEEEVRAAIREARTLLGETPPAVRRR